MESFSLAELQEYKTTPDEDFVYANYVYVSSLAMRTYKKSPLLKRYCAVRKIMDKLVLEFFMDKDDIEPTKRIYLSFARLVVSRSARLTSAQTARIERDHSIESEHSGAAFPPPHGGAVAFYIDFPRKLVSKSVSASRLYETRSLMAATSAGDFPLGFIMVASDPTEAAELEQVLSQGCLVTVPRERKRVKVQRWINRAWMKMRGDLSIDQFDEKFFRSAASFDEDGKDNFFTIHKTRGGPQQLPRTSTDGGEDWDEDDGDASFVTAGSDDDEHGSGGDSSEERIERNAINEYHRRSRDHLNCSSSTRNNNAEVHPGGSFKSVTEMFAESRDDVRHFTPISREEIESVVDYVEQTREYTTNPSSVPSAWSMCSQGDSFDCFKSIDDSSGVVRTRTWAKIRGIPPQTLFHILYNNEARKSWDHHYAKFDTEWRDGDLDIVDAVVTAPFGCANREFLEWRRCLKLQADERKNKYVIYLRSWDDAKRGGRPVRRGNVRAEVWLSGYIIQWWLDEESGEVLGSDVMVMTQIDVKGLIPKYLVNALSSSGPKRWVKSVTSAAMSEIQDKRGMTCEEIIRLTDKELVAMYCL